MSLTAERLYALLPAVYRVRDEQQGKPLHALVSLIAQELEALEENIEQLYDDQFIETCEEWVAPYIGDLIGYRPLHGVAAAVASPRAEVANTIAYRRRKGTAAMLEQLARDVTDWPARAVEFFEQLATTQYMNHVRLHAPATADLRSTPRMLQAGGPFNAVAHTAEMRRPESRRGALQHSERRPVPVAAAAVPLEQRAAHSRSRRCERPQVPLQPAGSRPAAVPPAGDRNRDLAHRRAGQRARPDQPAADGAGGAGRRDRPDGGGRLRRGRERGAVAPRPRSGEAADCRSMWRASACAICAMCPAAGRTRSSRIP